MVPGQYFKKLFEFKSSPDHKSMPPHTSHQTSDLPIAKPLLLTTLILSVLQSLQVNSFSLSQNFHLLQVVNMGYPDSAISRYVLLKIAIP